MVKLEGKIILGAGQFAQCPYWNSEFSATDQVM